MASGHVNRVKRPNTWLHRPMLQNVKKALANPEPSTHDPEQKSATSKVSSVDRSLKVGGRHRVAVIVATVLERVRRPARLASDKGS
jgi:hypothetical protein